MSSRGSYTGIGFVQNGFCGTLRRRGLGRTWLLNTAPNHSADAAWPGGGLNGGQSKMGGFNWLSGLIEQYVDFLQSHRSVITEL